MNTTKISILCNENILCTHEKTNVFITLNENIHGIYSNRVNILYVFPSSLYIYIIYTIMCKKAMFALTRQTLFQTPDCYFLSVKMQNKKVKHIPSTKYPYFHKITGPTVCFSAEKLEKVKKKFSYLLTNFFFQHVILFLFFFFFYALVFRQTYLNKCCRPKSNPQNKGSTLFTTHPPILDKTKNLGQVWLEIIS